MHAKRGEDGMTRDQIFAVVRATIDEIVESAHGQEISETASMRDYGADSLEIVEVISRSMKQLKIKVPRTELAQAESLGDLVDIFEQHATNGTQ
jgi:acyl carrier protein